MADQMYLVITVRKPVADREEGSAQYTLVKNRLAEFPGLEVNGHVTNHFTEDE